MSALFGGQTKPSEVSPVVGTDTQTNFFNALFGAGLQPNAQGGGFEFKPMDPYPGPLSPDINSTILPQVSGSWAPYEAGVSYLGGKLANGGAGLGIGTNNPDLQNMMTFGGSSPLAPGRNALLAQMNSGGVGPAATAANNTVNYGSPSTDIGTWMHNLAQYGAAGPAGSPLNSIAQGYATGPAAYLAPFLGQNTPWYKPPAIQPTTVSRTQ